MEEPKSIRGGPRKATGEAAATSSKPSASKQALSQPAGPHLFGLVNTTELLGHLHGGGDGSWERVLSLEDREARGRF